MITAKLRWKCPIGWNIQEHGLQYARSYCTKYFEYLQQITCTHNVSSPEPAEQLNKKVSMVSPCQSSSFLEPTLLTNVTKQQYAQGNKSPTLAQREGTYSQCIKVISFDLRPSKISWCHPCQARVLWQSLYSSLFLIQMWDVIRKQRFEAIF